MADSREPPPIEDQEKETENSDELFTSTVQTVNATTDSLQDSTEEKEQEQEEEYSPAEQELKKGDSTEDIFDDDIPEMSDITLEQSPDTAEAKPYDEDKPPATYEDVTEEKYEEIPPVAEKPKKDDMYDMEEKDKVHDLVISVSDPHKKGDGMNSFMSYKVKTKTTMPMFKRPELIVDRRFSDFLGLHEKLISKHRHVGRIVPPAPEKSIVGMTKIKMAKTEEEAASIDFVEKRRAALERYLNRIGKHKVLLQDPDFRDFLEQDDLPQATSTRALSGAGVMRFMKNVEGAISKITTKMNEEDVWFEEKQQQIESLEHQLHFLHSAVEDLVRHRKELASNTAAFAKSAATLGNAEEHTALSRALAQLSEAFEKVEGLHQEIANSDFFNVSEVIADYIRIIAEIKEIFQVRVKSWHNWQSAEQNLAKKRELEVKIQSSGRNDKLPQVQSDIKEATRELESRVKTSKAEFDELSEVIQKEILRFEKDRITDFKQLILVFLKMLMKSQEQNIKYWEGFLPEARAIA